MVFLFIVLAIWVIGAPIAYNWKIKYWDNTKFEKIWFSAIWPLSGMLYCIHWIHNNL